MHRGFAGHCVQFSMLVCVNEICSRCERKPTCYRCYQCVTCYHCLDSLLPAYSSTLCLINMHLSSLNSLSYPCPKSNPWFTSALHVFRFCVRRVENIWKRNISILDWSSFTSLRNRYHKQTRASKNSITPILYPPPLIIPVLSGKLSTTYYIASHPHLYLPTPQPVHLLTALPPSSLTKYLNFASLCPLTPPLSPHTQSPLPPHLLYTFSTFRPASESEISRILHNCPNKQSNSDSTPTWLLKQCSSVLTPIITNIVNLSLSSGNFHSTLKSPLSLPSSKTNSG